jgi:hypothetical protein
MKESVPLLSVDTPEREVVWESAYACVWPGHGFMSVRLALVTRKAWVDLRSEAYICHVIGRM